MTADRIRGLHLHIDGASGAAGDMMLGALIDLGVPIEAIGDALDAIGAGRDRLSISRVVTHGIAAVDVKVDTRGELAGAQRDHHGAAHAPGGHVHAHGDHVHAHGDHVHGPGDRAHHHYAAIRARIADAALTPGTRARALDIFDRIARAEARLHGMTVDDVAFHEVGAIDSVVDVVGTAAALDWLGPSAVTCSGIAMGHGTLTCAHGVLPVPAPAALEILREAGGVMSDGGLPRELCTPTGAAILAATVTRWTAAPSGRPIAIGWGAGDAVLADRPNALRVVGIDTAAAGERAERVWQIDANIDDMSPELCGPASEAVFAAGALDVWWMPITMKKGRPALMVSALATDEARAAVAAAILRETTTIGVRFSARERTMLARSMREVVTPYGPIPVKVAADGDAVWNAAPEFEACAAAAQRHGVPVKRVLAAALAAFEASR
ncbi:MAG: nickel pincer cofactor biosynthesis protein LarC [Deltaproteobacteria bacterium]|nr:MAG: nickel pincer cofactor biosynthesis protein LarC [Deltaproteobacteria bacterium]TMQ21978.1 MAG: nickel pincer cofactor biosynthesis protein LarC [Deltaproteobacteria bacterium]